MKLGDKETRMQLTGTLFVKPTGDNAYINFGDQSGQKHTTMREDAPVLQAEKGYHRIIRRLIGVTGTEYEFKLRENFTLILPTLAMSAGAATSIIGVVVPSGSASFSAVKQGRSYFISRMNLNGVALTVSAAPKTLGTDYTVDLGSGEVFIVPGGGINDGDNIVVTYATTGSYGAAGGADQVTKEEAPQYRDGLIAFYEFDQHAAGGTPRRVTTFTGQYWVEGDDDQDGKKPGERVLKIRAVDRPVVAVLK